MLCHAVQDASTASLVWVLTLMAEHPDVFSAQHLTHNSCMQTC
jgi:hypothetical protein